MLLQVFDRWGNLIFEGEGAGACWDGIVNGDPANSGSYAYQFIGELLNGKPFNNKRIAID